VRSFVRKGEPEKLKENVATLRSFLRVTLKWGLSVVVCFVEGMKLAWRRMSEFWCV